MADNHLNALPRLSKEICSLHFRFRKEDPKKVNKVYQLDIYLFRKCVQNLRMLFCQLKISALIHRNDLLDSCKVFKEFIPFSKPPGSTRSRSPKYQGK